MGKGFLVEGNTVGLNFTGVNRGTMGQGLPARVSTSYKGSVFLQDTSKLGEWIFYRGN